MFFVRNPHVSAGIAFTACNILIIPSYFHQARKDTETMRATCNINRTTKTL